MIPATRSRYLMPGAPRVCATAPIWSSGEPQSWNDLLKPSASLKGKITMLATDRWLMAAGMLAKGYSVNEADQGKIDEVKATPDRSQGQPARL